MKRPRMSLRLLCLATALIMSIVGWRMAVKSYESEVKHQENNQRRYVLEVEIQSLKRWHRIGTTREEQDKTVAELQYRLKAFDDSQ